MEEIIDTWNGLRTPSVKRCGNCLYLRDENHIGWCKYKLCQRSADQDEGFPNWRWDKINK